MYFSPVLVGIIITHNVLYNTLFASPRPHLTSTTSLPLPSTHTFYFRRLRRVTRNSETYNVILFINSSSKLELLRNYYKSIVPRKTLKATLFLCESILVPLIGYCKL